LRCGHCGRKLYVGYGGKAGRYYCQGALVNHGTERCISFGVLRVDHAVGSEVLRVLKPLGFNAAVKALEAQTSETSAAQRQLELALQQARFSAAHARRQYDAVDPANRLVAGELERRWNEALQVVHRIEGEVAALEARKPADCRRVVARFRCADDMIHRIEQGIFCGLAGNLNRRSREIFALIRESRSRPLFGPTNPLLPRLRGCREGKEGRRQMLASPRRISRQLEA
jgi:hypothetical protein